MYIPTKKWQRRLLRTAITVCVITIAYNLFILPSLLRWGASKEEFSRSLPGDELIKEKGYKNTLAVTVHAAPSQVWPWVTQMGLHKGGFYSYTWLENIFGCKLRNADRIHGEWQNTQTGYYECVCKSAEKKNMPAWIVTIVEPNKSFVWKGKESEWMMGVYIDSIDENTSRLITRQQFETPTSGTINWMLEKVWFGWAHCLMQHGMITGIKKRVEKVEKEQREYLMQKNKMVLPNPIFHPR
jgi:hypothetical protein